MTLYPADLSPRPIIARGTAKLASDYSGPAIAVYNSTEVVRTINFVGQSLDNSALAAHIATNVGYGRATTLFGQIGTDRVAQGLPGAPKIRDLKIGQHLGLNFEGGSYSGDVAPDGQIYSLVGSSDVTAAFASLTAKDFVYMAVIQASASAHYNQLQGVHRGTLVNLTGAGGAPVLQIQSDGLGDGVTGARWTVGDGAEFSFAPAFTVETTPIVLTVISSSRGVMILQNEEVRASISRSALVRSATDEYLGRLSGSVAGGLSEAFQGMLCAEMLWTSLTPAQAATRRAMLYSIFDIDHRVSRYNAPLIIFVGDSNMAGFKMLNVYSWEKRLQRALANRARFFNFGVPGSTITLNPATPPGINYAHHIGLFEGWAAPLLRRHKGPCAVVISNVGNDFLISPQPSAADVYAGHVEIMELARAANPDVKCIDCTGTMHHGGGYETLQANTNTLIRNGTEPDDVIDFAGDALLSINPGMCFSDNAHLSETGADRAVVVATPVVNAAFGW